MNNPMSKPHVAAMLDELIAMDAEVAGEEAMREAARLLDGTGAGTLRIGLVVADDAQGGWTNRWLFDAKQNFENKYEVKHGLAAVLLWSSEAVSRECVRVATMKAVYRTLWAKRRGMALSLGERMTQEGLASRFAGATGDLDGLTAEAVKVLNEHVDTREYGPIIACLYGDEAAEECGFRALGVPRMAGLFYAASEKYLGRRDPVNELE